MADFGFLSDLNVTPDETREFTMMSITLPNGKNPVLIGKVAGEANTAFHRAMAKNTIKSRKALANAQISPEIAVAHAKKERDEDRELYATHVITGWRDVCGGDSKDVKFSAEVCHSFFKMMPDDIFDQVRAFFSDLSNFRDTVSDDEAAGEGKG